MNEQIIKLAVQAGFRQRINNPYEVYGYLPDIERFAALVAKDAAAREREACAQLCDDEGRVVIITKNEILNKQCYRLADLIRARGKK